MPLYSMRNRLLRKSHVFVFWRERGQYHVILSPSERVRSAGDFYGLRSFDSGRLILHSSLVKLALFVFSLLIPSLACAGEADAVPVEILRKALEWMKSEDPERRKASYSTMQLLNEEALPKFQTALFSAKSHHEKRLGVILSGGGASDYQELEENLAQLADERQRVYDLIKIDYKKDPGKIKMLRNEVDGVARIFERASRLAKKDLSKLDEQIEQVAGAIVEISTELARIESHRESEEYELNDDSPEELRKEALADTYDGERYLKFRENRGALQQEIEAQASATKHNAASAWANSAQKDFAHLVNQERGVMGLNPLLLEEKLSDASTGHSKDMKSLGFFAHESPVEGKESPGQRAKVAGYSGRWTGENIYVGSSSHAAAYNAWFGSDGHRFIMFAKGPNQLGIGPVGRHWTMMTGRK